MRRLRTWRMRELLPLVLHLAVILLVFDAHPSKLMLISLDSLA